MKKVAAILGSVLFYIVAFLLSFLFALEHGMGWFIVGFPLVVAIYFVVAGTIFSRCLQVNRWWVWLSMNLVGGLCSWILLLICYPVLLQNGFVLLLIGPLIGVLAVVWAVVGLGFLCVGWFSRAASSPGGKRAWGVRTKSFARTVGTILLIAAGASLFVSVRTLAELRPASDYEDGGVHTFAPYDILPIRVEDGRNEKIVYKVYYRANDGSGYQYQVEGGTARTLAEQVYNRGPVERRVLLISQEDAYITIPPGETAESYTTKEEVKYLAITAISSLYLGGCAAVLLIRRNQRIAAAQKDF